MDLILARTFLMVTETGSFIDAGRRMNVTQSTVSARIKGLEDLLGRPLFERSRAGAALTPAGEQFRKHALALVRVWQHAQLELGLSAEHRDHLSVGAAENLWSGLLMNWVAWMRANIPDIAVSAIAGGNAGLMQRLIEGTLDLAVMHRPATPPGFLIEHLFDEEIMLVTSARPGSRRQDTEYVFIDWGPDFQTDHAAALPEHAKTGLNLGIGSAGIAYLLASPAQAYAPLRLVRPHLAEGRLRLVRRGPQFVYPVYMVYPEARDEEAYEPILAGLRLAAAPSD